MPIICQLCGQRFNKQINNKHLKYKHNITTIDYKKQFGQKSLSAPEYRLEKSSANQGENNPMYGKSQSNKAKQSISRKNSGKTPHNKGKKVTNPRQLEKLRTSIAQREERYRQNQNHPKKGTSLLETTKSKISQKVSEYAENHQDEIIERAQKILKTKEQNGYFNNLRQRTIKKHISMWADFGYSVEFVDSDTIKLTHNVCNNVYIRNPHSVINPLACTHCYGKQTVSVAELEISEWIKSNSGYHVINSDRSILDNKFEIDILIPDLKIGIEYNGLYWHNDEIKKSKWYHITKTLKCQEKGIRLIQIFEDEWLHKKSIVQARLMQILNLNNNKEKIYARKCTVEPIKPTIAKDFHKKHHIQGQGTGTVAYGLKYKNDLVAVMDFAPLSRAKGSVSKQNVWELTRFSVNGSIPGAAGKLFKAFVKLHNPETIISYSDCRWNTGKVYEKLGFKKSGTTVPNYWYVMGDKRYHRFKFRKDQLIKEGFSADLTEEQIMTSRGFKRVWDCGHDKWIWSKK